METGNHAHYFRKVKKEYRLKYDWFTIIRNPYTRILSEFNWYHMRVRQDNKEIFNYDIFKQNYNEVNRKKVKKFNITIRKLINNRDKDNGNHFSEQYLYFDDIDSIHILHYENKKYFNITIKEFINNGNIENSNHFSKKYLYFDDISTIHILHYENIREEYNKLMEDYDLPLRWDNENKINNRRTQWFSIKDFDKETIKLINEIYKKDFEIFGYEMMEV